jgi:hypothetical protein
MLVGWIVSSVDDNTDCYDMITEAEKRSAKGQSLHHMKAIHFLYRYDEDYHWNPVKKPLLQVLRKFRICPALCNDLELFTGMCERYAGECQISEFAPAVFIQQDFCRRA